MSTILLGIFIIIALNCNAQLSVVDDIMKLEQIVNTFEYENLCTFQYIDSIKFNHPYMPDGKSIGFLIVKINKESGFEFRYNIIEYSDKDLITHQLFRFYGLSESLCLSPFRSYFFFGKYLFYMDWCCPYWEEFPDKYKKL